jgi:hypothetical protein
MFGFFFSILVSKSACPGCKSNRSDWQNHLIHNYPITIIESRPYLKIELKKEEPEKKK